MWLSKTFVVLFAVFSFNALAEGPTKPDGAHSGGAGGEKKDGDAKCLAEECRGGRAIAPDKVRTKDVDLVFKLFPHLGKDYANTIFTVGAHMKDVDYLPWSQALEKAKAKPADETDTSATMAVLFGTVKDENRDAVLKQVNEIRAAELKKDKDKLDPKYMDLLDRLMWAGKAVTGVLDKSPESQEFLKKFVGEKLDFKSGDFKKIQEQNDDIIAKIKAAQTDPTAKAFLRDNLNRGAALSYAKDQVDKGNKEAGAGLLNAVSWKQGGTGPKFIDMVGPGNEPQRLFIGETPAEQASAIQAMGPKLAGTALSVKQFDKVAKEWWVKDGKLVPGVPKGATSAIAAAGDEKKDTKGDSTALGALAGGAAAASFDAKKAEAAVLTTCKQCHGATSVSGTTPADFKIKMANKGERSLQAALNAIGSVPAMKDLGDLGEKIKVWLTQK